MLKELETMLAELPLLAQASEDTDLLHDLITTVHRMVGEKADRGDIKIISRAFRELRYAFKTFAPYHEVRKVTVFGSARTRESDPAYAQAVAFARDGRAGYMVITGAGRGSCARRRRGRGASGVGVNIELPFEQVPNAFIHEDPKLIARKYFFTRKLIFVKESHAPRSSPGLGHDGRGLEVLTLQQTGKSAPMPIVFVDAPGGTYWTEWREYNVRHLLERGLISPEDMDLFLITDRPEVAVQEIVSFYKNYHSSRYVHERLVFRLNHPLPDWLLKDINRDFADLLSEGAFESGGALPEERNESDLIHLPRLLFWFNRKNWVPPAVDQHTEPGG
jgi:predicted Rossmann-fold nucleotide-binding protein